MCRIIGVDIKPVTLRFTSEPNTKAADNINKTLVGAYFLKAVKNLSLNTERGIQRD